MGFLEGTTHSLHATIKLGEKQFTLSPEISPTSTKKSPQRRYHGVLANHHHLVIQSHSLPEGMLCGTKEIHTCPCPLYGSLGQTLYNAGLAEELGNLQAQRQVWGRAESAPSRSAFCLGAVFSSGFPQACLPPGPPGKTPTSLQGGQNNSYPGKVLSTVPGM